MGTHYRGRSAEVRALDLLIKLSRSASALSDRLEEPLREQGFSASQFGLLEALLHLGPLEPCELGPKLLTSRPNVVLLVDQLERRGLVRRVPVAHDRRRILDRTRQHVSNHRHQRRLDRNPGQGIGHHIGGRLHQGTMERG